METTDFLVIGGGMMGAACARWLAEGGHRAVLVAPPEPDDPARHSGPFASHWDAGRITRRVAATRDWATLSARSIGRYADLEARSGIRFLHPSGALMSGPRTGPLAAWTEGFERIAAATPGAEILSGAQATARLPLHLPPDAAASYERGAGWIEPRGIRMAQTRLAVAAGAHVETAPVVALDGTTATLADGARIAAGEVVVATGPHAGTDRLLPRRPAMTVWGRTIALARVSESEAARLADLPSTIWVPEGWDHDLYLVPPARYPDGHLWLKLGGQVDSPTIHDDAAMRAWWRGGGEARVAARLMAELRALIPGLQVEAEARAPCAVVWTATGMPYAERIGPGLTLLAGGNGAAAKCGDELGRLGAIVAQGGALAGEGYEADFAARWEDWPAPVPA